MNKIKPVLRKVDAIMSLGFMVAEPRNLQKGTHVQNPQTHQSLASAPPLTRPGAKRRANLQAVPDREPRRRVPRDRDVRRMLAALHAQTNKFPAHRLA